MAATNAQVQNWSDQRVRPFCEELRKLLLMAEDMNASIGEVYENLTNSPTWTDGRQDAPPDLLAPSDLLAINTICVRLAQVLRGQGLADDAAKGDAVDDISGQLSIVLKACVRPVQLLG